MTTKNMTWTETLHDITVGGIDFDMEGYGGLECKEYSSIERRIFESVLYFVTSLLCILLSTKLSLKSANLQKKSSKQYIEKTVQNIGHHHGDTVQDYNESFRTIILLIYTLVNGIELGYKFVNRQLIFLLNYCHVASYIQIYLIATIPFKPLRRSSRIILEIMLYYQGGPIAAFLYPATEERIWTFEKYSYYIHHVLLLAVPIYLYNVYSPKQRNKDIMNNNNETKHITPQERQILQNPFNMHWLLYAYGIWLAGFVIMHWISYYTMANINVSLCPVDGVPGYGKNYRLHNMYWLMIFLVLSAVIYFGLTKMVSYLSFTVPRWSLSKKEESIENEDNLEIRRNFGEKEE